ncbi:cation:proton antiporter domain-containing protein [Sphingobacterium daejeonense]|uniref:cation:proton antiporter domain-containing protein n=1 Tax=Sphingobacterium daejeonense TaxID=371142 RepID=UPI0010C3CE69|nr:cation:proton antiporter [Sphingobacterium daejeonense]VTP93462.1 Sodium, potassium, lithium and rubidium/H(+) antiporter [Sphingobacterium daejeonense]
MFWEALFRRPDAVSTGAITKFVKIPKATSSILEGESLLNDASSLIIFRFALVAVGTGQFIWQEAGMDFLWMLFGGVGLGLLIGQIFIWIHKHLPTDAASDIALTLITPYFMYWVAEQVPLLGCSRCSGRWLISFQQPLEFPGSKQQNQRCISLGEFCLSIEWNGLPPDRA